MTRALDLPENQVRAIIRAAQKEGARVEVKIGGAVVTVIPPSGPPTKGRIDEHRDPASFATLDEYLAWRDSIDEGRR